MREVFDALRRAPATVNEIGAQLGLTHNAVRVHLRALEHEGLVRAGGHRHSGTRPAVVYEVVPRADDVVSGAYIPFVAQLLKVLGERTSARELDQVMQAVGRGLAVRWPRFRGGLGKRPRCCFEISAASGKVSRPRPYSTR
jgi:predicted ArsR family transcriptional regulator